MQHLRADQLAQLRTMLEQEATQLRERIAEQGADLVESAETDLRDVEDKAAREAMRFGSTRLLARDRTRLREVEAALERMHKGHYGVCEESDDPIPFRRLALDPATRYTAAAQEELERERASEHDPNPDEPVGY
jgi:DnaK suppressor protein